MPNLTPNYFQQGSAESLADIPKRERDLKNIRFFHILNPFQTRNERDMAVRQRTFETVRAAIRFAMPNVAVQAICVTSADDVGLVPHDFVTAQPLSRSVLDMAEFRKPAPLPLIYDVLDRAIAMADTLSKSSDCEDYLVFSNMDIHLQPHFYVALNDLVRAGYDSIDVTRRTVIDAPDLPLSLLYSQYGEPHGGTDCIVFSRKIYSSFRKNNACIGRSWVMRGVVYNCIAFARNHLVLRSAHLTFHLGNDMSWGALELADYTDFNEAEGLRTIAELSEDPSRAKRLIAFFESYQPWQWFNIQQKRIWAAQDAASLRRTRVSMLKVLSLGFQGVRRRLARLVIGWFLRAGV